MSDQLMLLPSLPPDVKGKIHGVLRVRLGQLMWLHPECDQNSVLFRLRFLGERSPGILLGTNQTRNENTSNHATYTIRCNQPIFINYLNDMTTFQLDLIDSYWRFIGTVKITIKFYFKRNIQRGQGKLASNFGFSDLVISGLFPIYSDEKKIGEVEVNANSKFDLNFRLRTEKELLQSFQVNELRAEFDETLPKQPTPRNQMTITHKETQGRQGKLHEEHAWAENSPVVPQEIPGESPKPEIIDPSISLEIEKLKTKGEILKKKLNSEYIVEETTPEKRPLPSIIEFENYKIPDDPTEDLFPPVEPARQTETFKIFELSSAKQLNLKITTLTLLLNSKDLKDKKLHLDCSIPIPSFNTQQKEPSMEINTDSFKIAPKEGSENIKQFNHEATHNISLGDGAFTKLAQTPMKFRLLASEPKTKPVEIGHSEFLWEKLLTSPGFFCDVLLEMSSSRLKSKPKVTGRLSIKLQLLPEKPKTSQSPKITDKSLPLPPKKVSPALEHKSFQLYLFIESATAFSIQRDPNLYITYKTFLGTETITTPVLWNYQRNSPIYHTMVFPLTANESTLANLQKSSLIIEVWDKIGPSTDDIVGIVKFPLDFFSRALSTGGETLTGSVYPLIAVDEYRAINDIKTGKDCGYLRACLALGTAVQVHRLQLSHQPAKNTEKPVEKKTEKPQVVDKNIETLEIEEKVEEVAEAFSEQLVESEEVGSDSEEEAKGSAKTEQEVIETIKLLFGREGINIEEELTAIDRNAYRYVSAHSLTHLIEELRVGCTTDEIEQFITIIVTNSERSTNQRIFFDDILRTLDLPVLDPSVNIKHSFFISLKEFIPTSLFLKSVYIKYSFPNENSYIESDSIDPEYYDQITLQALHTWTVPSTTTLIDTFDPSIGIQILLCKNESKCKEEIIGQGVLPIEEITDMAKGETKRRVICLYGQKTLNSTGGLIGKVRMCVEYSYDYIVSDPGKSVEFLYEKKTEVERIIPKNNILTIKIGKLGSLEKAKNYYKNIGLNIETLEISIRLVILQDTEMITGSKEYQNAIDFDYQSEMELFLDEQVLEYLKNRAVRVELVGKSRSNEEFVLGTSKIVLLPLLLNSFISDNFSILNDYTQHIADIVISLSLLVEDHELALERALPSPKATELGAEPPREQTGLQLTIESAMHSPSSISGETPNLYIQFTWYNLEVLRTPPVLRSTFPAWNSTYSLSLPLDVLVSRTPLKLEIWHKSLSSRDLQIGECAVDLSTLLSVPYIDGWYHIRYFNSPAGQLKLRVHPFEDLYKRVRGKPEHQDSVRLSPTVI